MNKLSRYIIVALGIALAAFIAWYFSNIVSYILISAVLSLIGQPMVNFFCKLRIGQWHFPRILAAIVAMVIIWLVFLLFFFVMMPLITRLVDQLSAINFNVLLSDISTGVNNVQAWLMGNIPGMKGDLNLQTWLDDEISEFINATSVINAFGSVANMLASMAVGIFAVTFITFFFLKENNLFFEGVIMLFPVKHEESARHALSSIMQLLIRYFIGIFVDMSCVMILLTAGLTLIAGLPFTTALVLGFIGGILNMIPYVGPIISLLVGCSIGVATTFDNMADIPLYVPLLKMAAVYISINLIDGILFQPYIYSNSIKAHPLEIFLVLLTAGSIAGIFGMIIAIPTYMVIRVFAKEFFNHFRVVQRLTDRM